MRSIPTLLSGLRLVMTPFIAQAIAASRFGEATGLLFIAGMTDFFDGFLARKYGWITKAGAIVDPIADKTLLVSVYGALWWAGAIPGWLLALVWGRDLLILTMAGIALLFTTIRDFPPSIWGKISTDAQLVTAGTILGHRAGLVGGLAPVCEVLVWCAAAGTIFSGLHYFYKGVRRLRDLTPPSD